MGDDPENPTRVKEIWSEVAVNGQPVVGRTRVSDETMVKLLLASDASIATYLTLAYEGDDNPITTIYKGLPLSSASGLSANQYISSLFSAVSSKHSFEALDGASANWVDSGSNVYTFGNVAIGWTDGIDKLQLQGGRMRIYSVQADNLHLGFRNGLDETNPMAWMGVDTSGNYTFGDNSGNGLVTFQQIGNVGIGTKNPTYKLAVNGSIGCRELTVTTSGWADFVFKDGYNLPPLETIETFIIKNKHLPGIPTEAEVKKNGISVGDVSTKLLQKVEELTLYMIDLKKENELLKAQIAEIQEEIRN